jgi:hypothetical protein
MQNNGRICDTEQERHSALQHSVTSANIFIYFYAEWHYTESHYAESHYAECHYAECRYAECHGANKLVGFPRIGYPINKIKELKSL